MEKTLKKAQMKNTPQRRAILNMLSRQKHSLTAEELYDLLPEGISLSTIYRNLSALTSRGVLIKTVGQDGVATYQPNTAAHCHRIVCCICGTEQEIHACPLKEITIQIKGDTGFEVMGHNLEFIGVCPACQREKKKHE